MTFRRLHRLTDTLDRIFTQTQPLDRLWVIDNEASDATARAVERAAKTCPSLPIEYRETNQNLGSAGGWHYGVQLALEAAADDDWIMPLDDDNPPDDARDFERIYQFARAMKSEHPKLGAVGIVGARFNWHTGFVERVADEELRGSVPVDIVGSGNIPLYSVAALRHVGLFDQSLFFGNTEVEFGLRLRRAGYLIVAHGEMWRERRQRQGRIGVNPQPSRICRISWKKYYVIRNYIYMMKRFGRWDLAAKQAVIQCIAKPLYTSLFAPVTALRGLRLAVKASLDGFLGRMGKRLEPVVEPKEPRRVPESQQRRSGELVGYLVPAVSVAADPCEPLGRPVSSSV